MSTAAIMGACLVAGCSTVVDGQLAYTLNDPNRAGGLPVTEGPSGIRDNAPEPEGEVNNTDDGEDDKLALLAVNDVEEFWEQNYDPSWEGSFKPVDEVISYDSTDPASPSICGRKTYGRSPNASWVLCSGETAITWDRATLVPGARQYFGDMSVPGVLAHEYGHHVQHISGVADEDDPTIVTEQQADCFAGAYMRWVAEGQSKRFQVSTGEALSGVIAGGIYIADPILTEETGEGIETAGHGTALDRVSAFQMGFVTGTQACAGIDLAEIDERREGLPILLQDESADPQAGNITIDETTLESLMEVSGEIFSPKEAPQLSFDSADCPDAKPSGPASYCPATNTISVDLPELQTLGEPAGEEQEMLIQGDNTALSVVMSRYALALLHEREDSLDTPVAGLRAACLTGAGQRKMAEPGGTLVLSAGDLDEAVAGLLTNGFVASDVDGAKVPAGFTRITAFRAGVQSDDMNTCYERFR